MEEGYKIILFYKFTLITDPEKFRDEQKKLCSSFNLKGRMLIASEGINATFEGREEDINKYQSNLRENDLFKDVVFKESDGTGRAFTRLEVKVRNEVVTLGAGQFDVEKETAPVITADQLQKMYENKEDFTILDLRNDYEVKVGHFENTINPEIQNFRELPQKLKELSHLKGKKVVAVCTGDIRCEKATCLMRREGFSNLFHLKDGIHDYMQKYPAKRFKGSLFVFDNRMTIPLTDLPEREIVGKCVYCDQKCENFYSDDSTRPSRKVICCDQCALSHKARLRRCLS